MILVFGTILWAADSGYQKYDPILWWNQNMLPLDTLNRTFVLNDTLTWVISDTGIVWEFTGKDYDLKSTVINMAQDRGCRFTDIFFIDEYHGWVIGKMAYQHDSAVVVCRTIDGGNRWTVHLLFLPDTKGITYLKVRFGNRYMGYVLANNGIAFKSNDGGISWSRTKPPRDVRFNE
jgi:photosystem II stability/assembly factor-like uncharacterized protein